jgi:hypothetical protein
MRVAAAAAAAPAAPATAGESTFKLRNEVQKGPPLSHSFKWLERRQPKCVSYSAPTVHAQQEHVESRHKDGFRVHQPIALCPIYLLTSQ